MDLFDQAIAFIIFFLVFSVSLAFLNYWGSKRILKRWARVNNIELLHTKICYFSKGPFIKASARQSVFEVEAKFEDGTIKVGHVCCGGFWTGPLVSKIQVKLG